MMCGKLILTENLQSKEDKVVPTLKPWRCMREKM